MATTAKHLLFHMPVTGSDRVAEMESFGDYFLRPLHHSSGYMTATVLHSFSINDFTERNANCQTNGDVSVGALTRGKFVAEIRIPDLKFEIGHRISLFIDQHDGESQPAV